ncbi:MAG: ATP-binding protein [Alphaproteobacteria bacterium]|nr:ATP-binding protein [Alphaproteobacteria bacterium]
MSDIETGLQQEISRLKEENKLLLAAADKAFQSRLFSERISHAKSEKDIFATAMECLCTFHNISYACFLKINPDGEKLSLEADYFLTERTTRTGLTISLDEKIRTLLSTPSFYGISLPEEVSQILGARLFFPIILDEKPYGAMVLNINNPTEVNTDDFGYAIEGLHNRLTQFLIMDRLEERVKAQTYEITEKAKLTNLLADINTAVLSHNNLDTLLQHAIDSICSYLNWPIGHIYRWDNQGGGRLTPSDIWHLDPPSKFTSFKTITQKTEFTLGEGLPGRVAQTKGLIWVEDINKDTNFPRATKQDDFNIKSGFGIPVMLFGKVVSVLEFFSPSFVSQKKANTEALNQVALHLQQAAERLKSRQALAESQQLLSLHLENTPLGFIYWDANLKCTQWNKAAEDIFGFSKEEILGQYGVNFIIPKESQEDAKKFYKLLTTSETSIRVVGKSITKAGNSIYCEWFLTPLRNDKGEMEGIASLAKDITAEKTLEQNLNTAKNEAEKASRSKSEFLSSMSHELRTPLNSILGFSQVMQQSEDEPLSGKQADCVSYIISSGKHLLKLIDEVLDLAKIESDKVQVTLGPLSLEKIVADCIATTQTSARDNQITIINEVSSTNTLNVIADKTRFQQIILNLMSNGIKYNQKGGSLTISCTERENGQARLTLTDTGKGISEEQQSLLFIPFERLNSENSHIEGTGIGLTITRKLTHLMGGKIGFKSQVGIGSSFWVDLPLTKQTPIETNPRMNTLELPAQDKTQHRYSILYVEDNQANQELVDMAFSLKSNFSLKIAKTAEDGLEIIKGTPFDLILMDINLPGMSGLEALAHLRAQDETKNIPIVAVTAAAMKNDIEKNEVAGFDKYITKPLEIQELFVTVDKLLNIK